MQVFSLTNLYYSYIFLKLYQYGYCSSESPLLWLRADPEMEYLAEVHFNQPVQMWVSVKLGLQLLLHSKRKGQ